MSARAIVAALLAALGVAALARDAAGARPLVAAAQRASEIGTVLRIAMPEGVEARDAKLFDVDADGRRDLIVVGRDIAASRPRTLRIHRRRASGAAFAPEPDEIVGLTPEVVAWALADVRGDKARELVLVTASAAFAWSLGRPEGEQDVERLFDVELLWQVPRTLDPLDWQAGVRDFDGDGLDDLLLPEQAGYRIAFQDRAEERGSFGVQRAIAAAPLRDPRQPTIDFPDDGETGARPGTEGRRLRRRRLAIGLGVSLEDGPGPLVAHTVALPAPWPCDYDGDGDLDLAFLGRDALHVALQRTPRAFAETPDLALDSPVARNRSRELDVSFAAHAADVDNDQRVDCTFLARDLAAKDVRTQLLVYTQDAEGRLFGGEGLPSELLVLAGFVGATQLGDWNHDGWIDCAVTSFRPDTLDAVRSAAGGALDLELTVFLRGPRGLARKPALSATIAMPLEDETLGPRFLGDVDGDGMDDLLVHDAPGRARVRLVRARGDRLELAPGAAREIALPEEAEMWVAPREPGAPPELVVLSRPAVVYAGF